MVPVPEEHAAAVAQFLQWNVVKMPSLGQWDQVTIAAFLADLDERSRMLLLVAAQASVDVSVLTVPDAAEAVGCSQHEALGIMMELNDAVRVAGGPPFVLATAELESAGETGPRGWSLNMIGDVAQPFLDAARGGVAEQG